MVTLVLPDGLAPEDVVAIKAVAAERARQRLVEGYNDSHDDAHGDASLIRAAAAYLVNAALAYVGNRMNLLGWGAAAIELLWPWESRFWKPKSPRRDIERAGALLVAELARGVRYEAVSARNAKAAGGEG